jgi:hypothetical protein
MFEKFFTRNTSEKDTTKIEKLSKILVKRDDSKELEEAIDHALDIYISYKNTETHCKCALEHKQLADWLIELQTLRRHMKIILK